MLYRILTTQTIKLNPKETRNYDAGSGVIMIPEVDSKIYVHWLNGDRLRSTLTLSQSSEIREQVKLINGLDTPAIINVIKI